MTHCPTAIERAVALLRAPLCVARMRAERLPSDVEVVLRILAGDQDATFECVQLTGKSRELIEEAAAFYANQILLHSTSDPYRVLGARPDATRAELRSNLALLLRWLRPDLAGPQQRSAAERVIGAWNKLKEEGTRSSIDASLAQQRAAHVRPKRLVSTRLEKRTDKTRKHPNRVTVAALGRNGVRWNASLKLLILCLLLASAGTALLRSDITSTFASLQGILEANEPQSNQAMRASSRKSQEGLSSNAGLKH